MASTVWMGGRARSGYTSTKLLADVCWKDMQIEWLSFSSAWDLGSKWHYALGTNQQSEVGWKTGLLQVSLC